MAKKICRNNQLIPTESLKLTEKLITQIYKWALSKLVMLDGEI